MFSVLIQNQKTIEYFQEFHPLFLEAINCGKVGCCRWIESGTTVDTALPGLCDLVADKEEWRAIIVRVEDEKCMSECVTAPENPYDFEMSYDNYDTVCESKIPFVRLSHMLGGIPMPEEELIPDIRIEEYKAPMPYFKRDESQEAKEKRIKNKRICEELQEKYVFDGKKPINIIFITFHSLATKNMREMAEAAWNDQLEIRSSDFWKKNRYPGNCRFIKYEYVKEGHVQKEADMFNFWTSVMLIATNDIDPSTLQAYRLYTVKTEFNKSKMESIFQNEVDRLQGSKIFIDSEIKRELEKRLNEKNPMPIYRMNIPVAMEMPSLVDGYVDKKEFLTCPKSINSDLKKWESQKTGTEEMVNAVLLRANRALAESSNKMRFFGTYGEPEVESLDSFQKEDMRNELSKLYDKILYTQSALSGTRNNNTEEVEEAEKRVKNILSIRIDKALATEIGILMLMLIVLSCIPAFMFSEQFQMGNIGNIAVCFIFIVLIFGIAEFLVLKRDKFRLNKEIRTYNEAMQKSIQVLTNDMKIFSDFVSNIVSYSRGMSYLRILKNKRFKAEIQYERLKRHLGAINLMLEKMKNWSTSFYLSIDYLRQQNEDDNIDVDINPRSNEIYSFEYNKEYSVPVNETGDTLYSPFGFIEKLRIDREELFEDARGYK